MLRLEQLRGNFHQNNQNIRNGQQAVHHEGREEIVCGKSKVQNIL
jgi:hypothetical protein